MCLFCQIDSPEEAPGDEIVRLFNIQNVKNVALNTHIVLENLNLTQGHTYYVHVIGKF